MDYLVTYTKQDFEAYEMKIYNMYNPDELLLHDLILFDLRGIDKGWELDDSEERETLPLEIHKDLDKLSEQEWTTEKVSSIVLHHCNQLPSIFQIYQIDPPVNSTNS